MAKFVARIYHRDPKTRALINPFDRIVTGSGAREALERMRLKVYEHNHALQPDAPEEQFVSLESLGSWKKRRIAVPRTQ